MNINSGKNNNNDKDKNKDKSKPSSCLIIPKETIAQMGQVFYSNKNIEMMSSDWNDYIDQTLQMIQDYSPGLIDILTANVQAFLSAAPNPTDEHNQMSELIIKYTATILAVIRYQEECGEKCTPEDSQNNKKSKQNKKQSIWKMVKKDKY